MKHYYVKVCISSNRMLDSVLLPKANVFPRYYVRGGDHHPEILNILVRRIRL